MNGFSSVISTEGRASRAARLGLRRGWGRSVARPLLTGIIARYISSSVVALCADAGSFLIFLQLGISPALAAAGGFSLGIVVNWLVSSRVMFTSFVAVAGPERQRQQMLFLVTALIGLVLTTAIVGGASALAVNPRLAKLVAVAVSFFTTSALRHLLVFSKPRRV
jgi:putative flippase GtrA